TLHPPRYLSASDAGQPFSGLAPPTAGVALAERSMSNSPAEHGSQSPTASPDASAGIPPAARRPKLRRLVDLWHDPWGRRFDGHQAIGELRARESEIVRHEPPPPGPGEQPKRAEEHGPTVRAAGRVVLQRKKGKLIFLDIRDWTGQIQVMIGRNQVGDD